MHTDLGAVFNEPEVVKQNADDKRRRSHVKAWPKISTDSPHSVNQYTYFDSTIEIVHILAFWQ